MRTNKFARRQSVTLSLSLRRRSPPLFPFGDVIIVADATFELNETRAHIHLRFKLATFSIQAGGEIDGSVFTKPLLLKCLEAFDKREWRYIEIVEEFVTKLFTITRNYKSQNHKSHVYFDLWSHTFTKTQHQAFDHMFAEYIFQAQQHDCVCNKWESYLNKFPWKQG